MAPILTIAIPTFNRADILAKTLDKLVNDPSCDDRVEIIVSDNNSTDTTKEVVFKYPSVKYFCNEENVADANFTLAIKRSTGLYVRLFNDTLSFEKGMLGKMLTYIEQYKECNCNLFFYDNNLFINNRVVKVNSPNQMLDAVSYYITWIANFGLWRNDFDTFEEPDKHVSTKLLQVDWTLSLTKNDRKTIVIVDKFFKVEQTKKKGNYSIFDVFINKYLYLLQCHKINFKTFKKEKYRLFRYFITYWYFLLNSDKKYEFDIKNARFIIMKHYWYKVYFLPLMLGKSILNIVKSND